SCCASNNERNSKTYRGVGERRRRTEKRRTLRDDSLRLANGIIFAAFRHCSRQSRRPRGGRSDPDCATARLMNEQPSKIYLLPNLMTAGNLFCGFTATLKIL